jgi:hypothetical protein
MRQIIRRDMNDLDLTLEMCLENESVGSIHSPRFRTQLLRGVILLSIEMNVSLDMLHVLSIRSTRGIVK